MKQFWPTTVLASTGVLLCALGVFGWRMLSQEKALAVERQRARIEESAATVEFRLKQAVVRGNAVVLRWDSNRIVEAAGAPLLWWPGAASGRQAPPLLFAEGEQAEFQRRDLQAAILAYRRLAGHSDGVIRSEALVRLARTLAKAGHRRQAEAAYETLAKQTDVWVNGGPAELVARKELSQTAQLRQILASAKYRLDRPTFEFFAEGTTIREEQRAWAEGAEALLSAARKGPFGSVDLECSGRTFKATWSGGFGLLIEESALPIPSNWALEDAGGRVVLGSLPRHPAVTVRRNLALAGLPWMVSAAVAASGPELALATSKTRLWGGALLALLFGGATAAVFASRAMRKDAALTQQQSEFVAAVSHEFRSPLTAISHLSEALDSGTVEEDRKPNYYHALSKESRRLRGLIEGLLEFARMDNGQVHRGERLSAVEFVQGVVEEFRSHAEDRELKVWTAGTGKVNADRLLLGRALWNLIDNAAKYSSPGTPILVTVQTAGRLVTIAVQDRGPGIPQQEQKRIFRRFVRGSAAHKSGVKGTGIGLAFVVRAAKAHRGRVALQSTVGEGSRFSLIIPEANVE